MEITEFLDNIFKKNKIDTTVKIYRPDQVNIYGAYIGKGTTIGPFVEIQRGVEIYENVKIQSHTFICEGVIIEKNCFIGHGVMFTNDKNPASVNKNGTSKRKNDWTLENTLVKEGANIGSNATILPGLTIGKYSLIGAGAVVTKNCEEYGVYIGNPAKLFRYNK